MTILNQLKKTIKNKGGDASKANTIADAMKVLDETDGGSSGGQILYVTEDEDGNLQTSFNDMKAAFDSRKIVVLVGDFTGGETLHFKYYYLTSLHTSRSSNDELMYTATFLTSGNCSLEGPALIDFTTTSPTTKPMPADGYEFGPSNWST